MLESLTLSRLRLLEITRGFLQETRETLELVHGHPLIKHIVKIEKLLSSLKVLREGDARRVSAVVKAAHEFYGRYQQDFGSLHPSLHRLRHLYDIFPALVIPLELRESSDVLMSGTAKNNKLAIVRMLRLLEKISRGGSPLAYARGLIVSMTEKLEHLQQAAKLEREIFGSVPLPVIPLFEEASSLADSPALVREMINDQLIGGSARTLWNQQLEIMVGYSDSSKEAGVLASRMAIARALPVLEGIVKKAGLTPIFFHGSGGSIDRGGGSVEDQTAWWPRSALDHYKVTIQGEMVERSFATRAITLSQIRHILGSARRGLGQTAMTEQPQGLQDLAKIASAHYRERIDNADFLELVEKATPYTYLSALKIGSRPTKRSTTLKVSGLRAIPWILCWTQSRILFPTWWGTGAAWQTLSAQQKQDVKKSVSDDARFYVLHEGPGLYAGESGTPRLALGAGAKPLKRRAENRLYQRFHRRADPHKSFFRGRDRRERPCMVSPMARRQHSFALGDDSSAQFAAVAGGGRSRQSFAAADRYRHFERNDDNRLKLGKMGHLSGGPCDSLEPQP